MADDSSAAPGPRPEADLLADPQLRALLAGYQPLHHDLFLQAYGRVLTDLYYQGERHEANLQYLLQPHEEDAYRYLWLIQRQKLFDLECQWRAGLVEVPAARLTADFDDWAEFIEDCPVVPPISSDELDLLLAFIGQLTDPRELASDAPTFSFWLQKHHPRRRSDDDDDDEPLSAWTEYWDLHRGTGYLRQLPDLRGAAEWRYEEAVRDEFRRTRPATPPADPRPQVPTYGPDFEALVRDWLRRLEPAARLRQYEAKLHLAAYDADAEYDDLPLALERLQDAGPGLVPIEAHADWRLAIIAASHRHYLGQLAAGLPRVYEAYCQRQEMGISHAAPTMRYRPHARNEYFEQLAERIREGRRLLGEPDDLNFWDQG